MTCNILICCPPETLQNQQTVQLTEIRRGAMGGDRMNIEKYTQNAQGAIMDCQNICIEEGHQQIDGEHLHLALMQQNDGLIPKLLKYMGKDSGSDFHRGLFQR